jgi:hypothetical protein
LQSSSREQKVGDVSQIHWSVAHFGVKSKTKLPWARCNWVMSLHDNNRIADIYLFSKIFFNFTKNGKSQINSARSRFKQAAKLFNQLRLNFWV